MKKRFVALDSGWSRRTKIYEITSSEELDIYIREEKTLELQKLHRVNLGRIFAGITDVESFLDREQRRRFERGEDIKFLEPTLAEKLDHLGYCIVNEEKKQIAPKYSDNTKFTYIPITDKTVFELEGDTEDEINAALHLLLELEKNKITDNPTEVVYFYEYEIVKRQG